MGAFPSGVTIVTAWSGDVPFGSTVSSFCSVSLSPPLLLMRAAFATYDRCSLTSTLENAFDTWYFQPVQGVYEEVAALPGQGRTFRIIGSVSFKWVQTLGIVWIRQGVCNPSKVIPMKPLLPPPIQGIVAGTMVWGIGRLVPSFAVSFAAQKPLAVLLAVTGLAIDLTAAFAFRKAKTTVNPMAPENANTLVVSGLYTVSRNPMYLGLVLILCGWALWLGRPAGLIPIVFFTTAITFLQIRPEEKALEEKFGAAYRDYKKQVRRWI